MKQKFYHMFGRAIDSNGHEHIVTIVGEYTKQKVYKPVLADDGFVALDNNKTANAILIYKEPQKVRKLRYAYSICHTDDIEQFDEAFGVEIAKRRIKDNPLGELETTFKTTLCDDQIKIILFGELKHIIDNIDTFIERI